MRLVVVVVLAACTPKAVVIGTTHPANPAAETGRLAGPPAALRPGAGK